MAIDDIPPSPPSDAGLSSLGLILQLAGSVFAAFATVYAVSTLILGQGMIALLLGVSAVRSMFQRAAGTELIYGRRSLAEPGSGPDQLAGLRRYIVIALVHSALFAVVLIGKFDAPPTIALTAAAALAVWPVLLAIILATPRFKALRQSGLPMPDDKGFEGASILMVIMGLMGALGSGAATFLMLSASGATNGMGMILLLALIALVIRSILHVRAGFSGLGNKSFERAISLAKQYANFGVIAGIGTAGALFLVTVGVGFSPVIFLFMGCVIWILLAWPLIIRRFYTDREFADMLDGASQPMHRRAPDGGLTSLGWFLLGMAAFGITGVIIQLGMGGEGGGRQAFGGMGAFAGGGQSIMVTLVFVALETWAAIELIGVTSRHRLVAQLFAIAGAAIQVYQIYPTLHGLGIGRSEPQILIGVLVMGAISLVTPIATFVLVNRKIRGALDLGSVFS